MLTIRPMTGNDIRLGMRLKERAGWNQTTMDWCRFLLCQPDGCFVAEKNSRSVGVTTTCMFGPVAWIGMVLVGENERCRGIGTALVEHAITWLERRGVATMKLDATSLGQPVYEKLGFVAQFQLTRYAGQCTASPASEETTTLTATDLDDAAHLDRAVVGCNRRRLLHALIMESDFQGWITRDTGNITGYACVRPGTRGTFVGPCIATTREAGKSLLSQALTHYDGRSVVIDVPQDNHEAVSLVESASLNPAREFVRMVRGTPVIEQTDRLWASSGPEMG